MKVFIELVSHISIQVDNDYLKSVSEAGDIGSAREAVSTCHLTKGRRMELWLGLFHLNSSPLPTDAIGGSGDTKHEQGRFACVTALLHYASSLVQLSVFGILRLALGSYGCALAAVRLIMGIQCNFGNS
ncbi:hypothetical protein JHK87_040219 [Glycine soja]|nr:hypothetical protein JHK87_040219 [Glycine soja]